jgi:hypothetical protein
VNLPAWILVALLGWAILVPGFRGAALDAQPPPRVQSDEELLEHIERGAFEYFRLESNPANGLIRDRSTPRSKCSIAAVGFGLSAWCIGVERGYVSRQEAADRVRLTLQTFRNGPQGDGAEGVIGHRGWFYHFLEMETATRAWKCELSSIDTALFLAGAMDCSRFFNRASAVERGIRQDADELLRRVDWRWMCDGADVLSMGWHPERGFIPRCWVGYNEGMLLYVIGIGAGNRPLPPTAWQGWTRGYVWGSHQGQEFLDFPPLFGHQYSHCWIDFRGLADDWMRRRGLDYFENSRRAVLSQRAYCAANPGNFREYGPLMWGITASDGPQGYGARGAPPAENDDGTIAPTAVGASIPFAPEACLPTLRNLHERWGDRLWTRYGYRDAFNPTKDWVAEDVLGIDQGAMMLMIENHRTGSVWKRMMGHPVIQRGLRRAGFQRLSPELDLNRRQR